MTIEYSISKHNKVSERKNKDQEIQSSWLEFGHEPGIKQIETRVRREVKLKP